MIVPMARRHSKHRRRLGVLVVSWVAAALAGCSSGGAGGSTAGSTTAAASTGGSNSAGGSATGSGGGNRSAGSSTGAVSRSTGAGSTAGGGRTGGGTTGAASSGGSQGTTGGGADGGIAASACENPSCTVSDATCAEGANQDVYDNQWCCSSSCNGANSCPASETLYACSWSSWYVVSNAPAGNTAVLTYVSSQLNYPSTPQFGSFNSITSTFAEVSPHGASSDFEAAYDLWFNDYANEVMIWVDNDNQTPGGAPSSLIASHVSVGGGTYDVYLSGSTMYFVAVTNFSSGTVDILSVLKFAASPQGQSWLPADSTITQFNFGWEICSTNGQDATFYLDDFSITAS